MLASQRIDPPGGLHLRGQPKFLVGDKQIDAADFLQVKAYGIIA